MGGIDLPPPAAVDPMLLRAIAGWRRDTGARLTFVTAASVNLAADPELLGLMAEAGFKKVFLGLETPEAESLEACAKFQNARCDELASPVILYPSGKSECITDQG